MEYRMYCLVLRHLSGMNKGVQSSHVCMEYGYVYRNTEDFKQYITKDKTMIVLDGGTSQDLEYINEQLDINSINHWSFNEPDINNCITAVCFLVDNRVWDRENYYTEKEFYEKRQTESWDDWCEYVGGVKNAVISDLIKNKKLAM